MYVCKTCNYKTDLSYEFKKHLKSNKHLKNVETKTEWNEEEKKYHCILCRFETNFEKHYDNHLNSLYHKSVHSFIKNLI